MVHCAVVHAAVIRAAMGCSAVVATVVRAGRLCAITGVVSLSPAIEQLRACAVQRRIDRLLVSNVDADTGAGQLVPDPFDDFAQLGPGHAAYR
ncbi:hypothetical protein W7S_14280 [Mycobacterium sp. MOTT36Y]|nr:hypothetical protein W7S_14280 [Mycobacterium sp. MOTT36Y]